MGWFDRLRPKSTVPDWAPFFDVAAYEAFLGVVKADLDRRGLSHRWSKDGLEIHGAKPLGVFGLVSLAQRCHLVSSEMWPTVVARHFDELLGFDDSREAFEREAADLDRVRARLRVRLYHLSDVPDEAELAGRAVAGQLFAALVYDHADVITPVPQAHIERWNVDGGALMNEALERVREDGALTGREMSNPPGTTMWTGSFYAATHLLFASRYVEGEHRGLLLACPNRHTLFIHPMRDRSVLDASSALIPIVQGLYDEGPVSISRHLYFFSDDEEIEEIVTGRGEDGRLTIAPTEAFNARVRELVHPN